MAIDFKKKFNPRIKARIRKNRQIFGKKINNFFDWINGADLVELKECNVSEDPVRPELDNVFRRSYGRKIFGVKYKVNNKTINTESVIDKLDNLGYYTIFCNTLPTWFGGIYGNMMCIKKKYRNHIDDTNYTFSKSEKSCIVSGNIEGTKETIAAA